jgi:hypothetical protein
MTDEEVRRHLIQARDCRLLRGEKQRLMLVAALAGGPFMAFLVFLGLLLSSAPLWPALVPILLNLILCLVIGIGHRPIPWGEFEALPAADQERRANYDSFW